MLAIDGGSQLSSDRTFLGADPGSTGVATVAGPGSTWNNSSKLYIGYSGSGALLVEAGGQVSNNFGGYLGDDATGSGTARITGAGSTWTSPSTLVVGKDGRGELHVEAGGQVINDSGYLGAGSGSTGTATVSGAGSMWTSNSALRVGNTGSGALRVDAGGQVSSHGGYLGDEVNSTGTATISGAGSKWANSATLYVGNSGSGSLRVEAGGQVSSASGHLGVGLGSTGMATITGAGSMWINSWSLAIGGAGNGALTVEDGGHVAASTLYASLSDLHGNGTIAATAGAVLDANLQFDAAHPMQAVFAFGAGGTLTVTAAGGALGVGYKGLGSLTISEGVAISSSSGHLGRYSSSTGTARITGAGSTWANSSALYIGGFGSQLLVEAGGRVSNAAGYLSAVGGSTAAATISGAGSKWVNDSELTIGDSGSGALSVEAGGQVSSARSYLGRSSDSTGTATISGPGSTWTNSTDLHIGSSGNGALRVEAGGHVSSRSGYLSYSSSRSAGMATISGTGSKWTNVFALRVGNAGSGSLRVEDGGEVSNTAGTLGYNSRSTGTATITGAGSTWTNSASLDVGRFGAGSLTITAGGLVSVRGMLTTDLNGGDDSFINLAAGGILALWGDADDSLAHFLGLVSGTDAIRYWNASLAGWTPLTTATPGVDYTLQYKSAGELTGYTLLTVLAPGPAGDFNYDGRVDGADFVAWQRGSSPLPNSAEDLATWRANFGLGATTPGATAVPEPGTFALVGLASSCLLLGCRATRGRQRTS